MSREHQMSSRRSVLAWAVGGTAAVSGCLGIGNQNTEPPIEALQLRVIDIRKPEFGATTATLTVVVGVSNPTEREMPAPTADLDLHVNGQVIATSDTTFATLAPGDDAREQLRFTVEYISAGEAVLESLRDHEFEVSLRGELTSGEGTEPVNVSGSYP